jgi:transcriptional regulator with GAF, ATPase, and Fis domain/pSer/pThr/pTyr-binding forkhead associated (FHA) protein
VNPRLSAISGPLRDSVFPLKDGELSIGRELSNHLSIDDALVSPRHCAVVRDGERWTLRDLGSASGTFVNGLPVQERPLADGDQVAVGGSVFLFLNEEATEARPNPVEMGEVSQTGTATTRLRREDMRYLQPGALAALPTTERLARDLQTLLKISTAIGSIRNVESLQWQLLGMIFDVVPAERGAILLGQDPDEFSSVVGWDRVSGPQHSVHVDRRIARQVLEERIAMLSNDVNENNGAPAVRASHDGDDLEDTEDADEADRTSEQTVVEGDGAAKPIVHSLLCVPLVNLDQVIGLIYLDTTNPQIRFAEDDLHLVTAIAGVAAMAIESARQVEWLGSENRRLRATVDLDHDMVGESQRMREVYALIEKVAASDSTVLIYGESGTGKELAARAIHRNSTRRDQPFVAINCAALTETLLESELFGHERGAFTGAIALKRGQLEMANGGTIFLDEMGEISPAMQAKLLRVLEEGEVERVGGDKPVKVNVRVVVATHRNLEELVAQNAFRRDLFHRIYVFPVVLPPLRERPEDFADLVTHFSRQVASQNGWKEKEFSREAIEALQSYGWPGNVRELRNVVERLVLLAEGERVSAEDVALVLPAGGGNSGANSGAHSDSVGSLGEGPLAMRTEAFEKEVLLSEIRRNNFHMTKVAKTLGLERSHLYKKCQQLGIDLQALRGRLD